MTELGVVMGAARVLTLDHLGEYRSMQPTLATISIGPDGQVALEHHTRHVALTDSGVVSANHHPDLECGSYLIDETEVIDRRSGRERSRTETSDMFTPLYDGRTAGARDLLERIKEIIGFLEQSGSGDVFDPTNLDARRTALDILDYRGTVRRLIPGVPLTAETQPGFPGHRIGHRIMDRAAWVALQGIRPEEP